MATTPKFPYTSFLKGYIVKLTSTQYGPVHTRQEACKLAMEHATYTRRPKIYALSGEYIGEVHKVKTTVKRKGSKGYHYLFISADGTFGNIVSTTGMVQKQYDPSKKDYWAYENAKYLVYLRYHKYGDGPIIKADTINKARKLAIKNHTENKNNQLYDIYKWNGKNHYEQCGRLFCYSLSNIKYLIDSTADIAYRAWGRTAVKIDPMTGEIIGKD